MERGFGREGQIARRIRHLTSAVTWRLTRACTGARAAPVRATLSFAAPGDAGRWKLRECVER